MENNEVSKKKSHKVINTILVFITIIIIFILWAFLISPRGLEIKEYAVYNANLPENFNGFKIVHFSDLHYGRTIKKKELENLVEKINELNPDVIVFTGDLFDKHYTHNNETLNEISDVLSKLEPELKKYSIKGNHDYEQNGFEELFEKSGFIVLNNSYDTLYYKGVTPIYFVGIPSMIKDTINYDKSFEYLNDLERTENLFQILLLHEPDNIDNFNEYNISLALAGHSHGGQVRLPFIGKVITPLGSKNYYDEYYKVNKTDLYISYGVGTSGIGVRFLNKPSVNLYRLYTN